ncbi:hypothetical protein HF1_04570 [Mycoplasma haemofelis str. Langford 1]|uniref:Uncharacterized protein n=1 Tax=Mycoplasma haemofelis (strain Langford 1) TaxID=941640 RepID=E8ZH44_MYCHL|nr:hypothetical protein [Mycoplasma haemofelis]CBY92465.1 hypothetical protein HF1_04570 [Mycoplasma haemofelis str. Langford 1]
MQSNNLLIGTIGIGGLIAGTLIAGFIHFNSKEKFAIKDLVAKDTSRTIVSSSEHWKQVWDQYVTENKGKRLGNDSLLLDDWNERIHTNTNVPFSYKDRCDAFGRYKVEDDNNLFYKTFIKHCTITKDSSSTQAQAK